MVYLLLTTSLKLSAIFFKSVHITVLPKTFSKYFRKVISLPALIGFLVILLLTTMAIYLRFLLQLQYSFRY